MKASEIRQKYLDFFRQKDHRIIAGASLIPENDPSVLFTTAGMHPLVPYLLGEKHPEGQRLTNVQKCIRTGDIDEVGDNTHLTFFEMLGNWSLGDYFKEEAIHMSYEFLTLDPSQGGLGLDPDRLAVTCFEGDSDAARDEDAAKIWESLGFVRADKASPNQKRRIFFYNKKENWWGPAGNSGPCGPDTEMFYYNSTDLDAMWESQPSDDNTPWVEIWNDVFMEYYKSEDGQFTQLSQKNVDTGMGLERVTAILQGKSTAYDTELFASAMLHLSEHNNKNADMKSLRIIADHLRAATFILGDERGILPGNQDQAYILRRLIRRAIRHGRKLDTEKRFCVDLAEIFVELYKDIYPELSKNKVRILEALKEEEDKFRQTLENGEDEIIKDKLRVETALDNLDREENDLASLEMSLGAISQIISDASALGKFNGVLRPILGKLRAEHKAAAAEMRVEIPKDIREVAAGLKNNSWTLRGDRAFYYFETHGFPLEMTGEILSENSIGLDEAGFQKAFAAHQEKSRAGSEQKFSGGLADHSNESKRLHTATHLMLEALRRILGKHVEQKGSNITSERLRFDFNHSEKMSAEEIAAVEKIVNDAINADHKIHFEEMRVEDARKLNATGVFVDKYEDELDGKVKVYFMGDFSKEICGGPHVDHTGELGKSFKIIKEESSSAGIRRIKAVLS